MSEHQEESFRHKNLKQKIGTVVGVTLFLVVILGFIIGIYLLGLAGIFELLGIEYASVWSLLLFVVAFFICASIIELFTKPISELLTEKVTNKLEVLFVESSIQGLTNWLCLFVVDMFMESITLSLTAGIIVAIIMTVIEMVIVGKE